MSTILKHKRNAVAGTAPTTASLEVGEIALNTADGYVYLRRFVTGGVDEIVRIRANPLVGGGEVIAFSTALTTTAVNQSVDSFPHADYRTAKYLIQMTSGSSYQSTEVLIMHDGTDVYITEYATIASSTTLGTVSAVLVGSSLVLRVSPVNANTTVKGQRIGIVI